jgi:hypothetical protein
VYLNLPIYRGKNKLVLRRSEVIDNKDLDHEKLIIPSIIKEHSASVYNRSSMEESLFVDYPY